jgi:K+:H+ antiporter
LVFLCRGFDGHYTIATLYSTGHYTAFGIDRRKILVYLAARSQGYKTQTAAAFGLSSSGGELALDVAKCGTDVGATSLFVLPMVGAMTIITTFITPYLIKMGWKFADYASTPEIRFSIRLWRRKK